MARDCESKVTHETDHETDLVQRAPGRRRRPSPAPSSVIPRPPGADRSNSPSRKPNIILHPCACSARPLLHPAACVATSRAMKTNPGRRRRPTPARTVQFPKPESEHYIPPLRMLFQAGPVLRAPRPFFLVVLCSHFL